MSYRLHAARLRSHSHLKQNIHRIDQTTPTNFVYIYIRRGNGAFIFWRIIIYYEKSFKGPNHKFPTPREDFGFIFFSNTFFYLRFIFSFNNGFHTLQLDRYYLTARVTMVEPSLPFEKYTIYLLDNK